MRRGGYGNGGYKFTGRRKAALRKAQAISARRRKAKRNKIFKGAAIGGGVLATVGAAYVLGSRKQNSGSGGVASSVKGYKLPQTNPAIRGAATVSVAAKEAKRKTNPMGIDGRVKVIDAPKSSRTANPTTRGAQGLSPAGTASMRKTVLQPGGTGLEPQKNNNWHNPEVHGSVDPDLGIPKAVLTGRAMTNREMNGFITKESRARVARGQQSISKAERAGMLSRMRESEKIRIADIAGRKSDDLFLRSLKKPPSTSLHPDDHMFKGLKRVQKNDENLLGRD